MDNENVDRNLSQGDYPEIALVTSREALRREFMRIEVPEDSELSLSPTNREYARCFARVHLQSYEDLQTLGFVPRRLPEERVREAIATDDEEAFKLASTMMHQPVRDCGCESQGAYQERASRSTLRTAYNSVRKSHNRALAGLLSDHYGTHIAWDSPLAGIVRKWDSYLGLNAEIVIALLEDIIINRNATLAVAANAKSLLAHNIWVHDTGRLVLQGSYTKVWANSVNRFSILRPEVLETLREQEPPWSLSQ
jgi:hypothetical protein